MAADATQQLNYALPVVRFLGVRRARILVCTLDASAAKAHLSQFEPAALRPAPEGLWPLVARAAAVLLSQGERPTYGFILDAEAASWWRDDGHAHDPDAWDAPPAPPIATAGWWSRHRLSPVQQPVPSEAGLDTFLKGLWYAPEMHLVLADWLEDQSGPSALTAALRHSGTPPAAEYGEVVAHDAFRWRWLGRGMLCYFSRRSSATTGVSRRTTGYVLGLLHGSPGEVPRRWARWLGDGEVARQLAAEMGVELPEGDEPWVWV